MAAVATAYPRSLVTSLVRESVEARRARILAGDVSSSSVDDIARDVLERLGTIERPSLRRVVNATGVVVHTNLGRSVLAPQAVEAVNDVARGYSTLEYDCATRKRGSRHDHYERLVCRITGAEAAIAVNNNAAAVMMVLQTFAQGHDAIISRGEQVEIGGSFRIPDIMELTGAHMVEVGTTNKTHEFDYERALTPDCAMFVKVHPSNYRMTGFTEGVDVGRLRAIADSEIKRRKDACNDRPLLVYLDLGSGAIASIGNGDAREMTVMEALKQGADLVSFSCDKLLGGPQAGIIVGKKGLIDRLKKSPLARVLRLDKMTLAALEATLRLYLDDEHAYQDIPTVRMLTEDVEVVRGRAERLRDEMLRRIPKDAASVEVVPEVSRAGGGALPMYDIPTYACAITFDRGSAQKCFEYLVSERRVPVIARINADRLIFDARTLLDDDEISLAAVAVGEYFAVGEDAVQSAGGKNDGRRAVSHEVA